MENKVNETNVVENAQKMLNESSELNAKDVVITLSLGALAVAAGVAASKAIKKTGFSFKKIFAKKTTVEQIVDEVSESTTETAQA